MVQDNKVAWQLENQNGGKNQFKIFNLQKENRGHRYKYENFTKKQIRSLVHICKKLKKI